MTEGKNDMRPTPRVSISAMFARLYQALQRRSTETQRATHQQNHAQVDLCDPLTVCSATLVRCDGPTDSPRPWRTQRA